MRQVMFVLVLTVAALASEAAFAEGPKQPRPGAWWLSLGMNMSHVEHSEENCFGGQVAATFGRRLFLRVQRTSLTYERSDNTDTCDALLAGDSSVTENALSLGIVSRQSGLFVAAGPARVHVEETFDGPWGKDTAMRYELGWSSRHARGSRSWAGMEIVLFATNGDIRRHHGLALNFTFGPRS